MRRLLALLGTGLLLPSLAATAGDPQPATFSQPGWMPPGAPGGMGPVVSLERLSPQKLHVSIEIPGFRFDPGTNRVSFSGEATGGAGQAGEAPSGAPAEEQPARGAGVIHRLIAIPAASQVSVQVVGERIRRLENWGPAPGAAPVPDTALVRFSTGRIRGQHILDLEIRPFRQLAGGKALGVAESVDLEIRFSGPGDAGPVDVGPFAHFLPHCLDGYQAPALDSTARLPRTATAPGTFVWAGSEAEVLANHTDYLLIVADALAADPVTTLGQKRAAYDHVNVTAIRAANAVANPPSDPGFTIALRDFVSRIYWNNAAGHMSDGHLGYLLLVGDDTDANGNRMLPTYTYPTGPTAYVYGSDSYFARVESTPGSGQYDAYADIFFGRLSVDNAPPADGPSQLENVVNKIVDYEPLPRDAPWRRNVRLFSGTALTVSGGACSAADWEGYFGTVRQNIPASYNVTTAHRMAFPDLAGSTCCSQACYYDPQYSLQYSQQIGTAFDDSWIIDLIGHGNRMVLQESFLPRDADPLRNDPCTAGPPCNLDKALPLVFVMGCQMGTFNSNGSAPHGAECCAGGAFPESNNSCYSPFPPGGEDCDVISERLMKQRGGAIGVIGFIGSVQEWDGPGVNSKLFESIFTSHDSYLGEILFEAMFRQGSYLLENLSLQGDPMLNIQFDGGSVQQVDLTFDPDRTRFALPQAPQGGSAALQLAVRNKGLSDVQDVRVDIFDGPPGVPGSNPVVEPLVIPAIGAYHTEIVTANIPIPTAGSRHVYAVIDFPGTISEFDEGNNQVDRTVLGLPPFHAGFPVALGGSSNDGAPLILDLAPTATPGQEIVVQKGDGQVTAFTSGGIPLWSYAGLRTGTSAAPNRLPTAFDFNRDGAADVVFRDYSAANDPEVVGIDGSTGREQFRVRVASGISYYWWPTDPELKVAWAQSPAQPPRAAVVGGMFTGKSLTILEPGRVLGTAALGPMGSSVQDLGVADLDGDGAREIVVTGFESSSGRYIPYVKVLDATGVLRYQWTAASVSGISGSSSLLLADLDQDGALEITVADASSGSLRVFDRRLEQPPATIPIQGSGTLPSGLGIADLDGDGTLELVLVRGTNVEIYRYLKPSGGAGQLTAAGVPALAHRAVQGPILYDLNGDGRDDLAVKTSDATGTFIEAYQFTFDGQSFRTSAIYPWGAALQITSGVASTSQIALGDLDGTGSLQCVFTTNETQLHAVDLPGPWGAGRWRTSHGNCNRDDLYEQPLGGQYAAGLCLYNRNRVTSDVTVTNGAAFEAFPGTVVGCISTDPGGFMNEVDFHLSGPVQLLGTAAGPIVFSGDGTNSGWGGLFFEGPASTANLAYVRVRDAVTGIDTWGAMNASQVVIQNILGTGLIGRNTITLADSRLSDIGTSGASFDPGIRWQVDRLTLQNVRVAGVQVNGPPLAGSCLRSSILVGGSGAATGIQAGDLDSGTLDIDSCEVSGWRTGIRGMSGIVDLAACNIHDNGYGVLVSGGTLVSSNTDFVRNQHGVRLIYSGGTLAKGHVNANTSEGAYLAGSSPAIDGTEFKGNGAGIRCSGASPSISNCTITGNTSNGIEALGGSSPVVRYCTITGNQMGVRAEGNSWPNLGAGSNGKGNNSIASNTVCNVYEGNSEAGTLMAEYNWWSGVPRTTQFFGTVDYLPYLMSRPSPPDVSLSKLTTGWVAPRAYPSPFAPGAGRAVTVEFGAGRAGTPVAIEIFDVRGRRIRTLLRGPEDQGLHQVFWQGEDARGRQVASGSYFLVIRLGPQVYRRKIVLAR